MSTYLPTKPKGINFFVFKCLLWKISNVYKRENAVRKYLHLTSIVIHQESLLNRNLVNLKVQIFRLKVFSLSQNRLCVTTGLLSFFDIHLKNIKGIVCARGN